MQERNASEIVELPLSKKEEDHRSRKRRAFHVFVSRYVMEFKTMDPWEQHEKVWSMLEVRADNPDPYYSDEDSTDSHIERREESVGYRYAYRCACAKWRYLSDEIRSAWNERTTNLNARFLSGAYVNIPNSIGGGDATRLRMRRYRQWLKIIQTLNFEASKFKLNSFQ